MRTTTILWALLAASLLSSAARAEKEEFAPAACAKIVAPFIGDVTVAVVRVELSQVDVDRLAAEIGTRLPASKAKADAVAEQFRQLLDPLVRAGGRELYGIVSLADLPPEALFLVVPVGPGSSESELKAALASRGVEVAPRRGSVLVAGRRETLDRLEGMTPDERPELVEAFRAAGDAPFQALLLPPKHTRRVIEEMMPELPKAIGGGPSSVLTRGLLWAAASLDTDPGVSVRLVIQSEDARAAEALRTAIRTALDRMAQREDVRRTVPKVDEVAKLLVPEVHGDRLVLTLDETNVGVELMGALVGPPLAAAREGAARSQSMNNLKHVGLAMHNWHDRHKGFPAPANYDNQGRPLLSWRVLVLPFLGEKDLFEQFHLDEPWDSPHNRTLIDRMPAVYRSPASKRAEKGRTSYLLPVGEETVFPAPHGVSIRDITDGTANTIMAVEVGDEHAVVWTKPQDLPFDPENPARGLRDGPYHGGFLALFCDGSVHFIADTVDRDVLRAFFTRAGKEPVSP